MKQPVPVHILSGFLGSGKTTLLTQALDYYKQSGKKPAVLMNELGDVNLDGMLVEEGVPMTEMLSGCICCTIRGDLGLELRELIQENEPDVIFVECTGAANPMEILDGVTDASLLTELELRSVITVIDAAQLLEQYRKGVGKTYRLMQEQIRCASHLILNKTDLVSAADLSELEAVIREWNAVAPITATIRCIIDLSVLEQLEMDQARTARSHSEKAHCSHNHNGECSDPSHSHTHEDESCSVGEDAAHHSHDHVMVYTHYFKGPINSEQFEDFVGKLPSNVYRAKGILRFTDTTSPFMFQYAYREMDFVKITPKEELPNVAVFIGEHFSKQLLATELDKLEIEAEAQN